jgi:hypothetical protein
VDTDIVLSVERRASYDKKFGVDSVLKRGSLIGHRLVCVRLQLTRKEDPTIQCVDDAKLFARRTAPPSNDGVVTRKIGAILCAFAQDSPELPCPRMAGQLNICGTDDNIWDDSVLLEVRNILLDVPSRPAAN